jgi:hypothetical protein
VSTSTEAIEELANREYRYGFVTDVEQDAAPRGLNEDIVRLISRKKGEPAWMLEWRLKAYRMWLTMKEPTWANITYGPIDYQDVVYYSAPKKKPALQSLDEIDPEVRRTFEKLGIPLHEQKLLSGVAVDAVFDSVSVATTFKEKLAELGIIFCSFSEAVQNHPDLVRKYMRHVGPLGGGRQIPNLHVVEHALAKRGHGRLLGQQAWRSPGVWLERTRGAGSDRGEDRRAATAPAVTRRQSIDWLPRSGFVQSPSVPFDEYRLSSVRTLSIVLPVLVARSAGTSHGAFLPPRDRRRRPLRRRAFGGLA